MRYKNLSIDILYFSILQYYNNYFQKKNHLFNNDTKQTNL